MTEIGILLGVTVSIGRTIVSEWLDAKTLTMLDIAYCSRVERPFYLELLNNAVFMGDIMDISEADNLLKWMYSRNLKCLEFNYCSDGIPDTDFSSVHNFIQRNGTRLEHVSLESDPVFLVMALNLLALSNCALESLEVHYAGTEETASSVPLLQIAVATIVRNSSAVLTQLSFGVVLDWTSIVGATDSLPALWMVDISAARDEDLVSICRAAPNVTDIILTDPRCSHVGLSTIGQYCPSLEELQMNETQDVKGFNEGLIIMAKSCPKLSRFVLVGCPNLTDIGLTAIVAHCTQLRELEIGSTDHVTDRPLEALAYSGNVVFQSLTLSVCSSIMGHGICRIADRFPELHTLQLMALHSIVSVVLDYCLTFLHKLKSLCMFVCPVTDSVLRYVAVNQPLLEELNVGAAMGGTRYTSEGLMHIADDCKHLHTLHCDKVLTAEQEASWKSRCPNLQIEYEPDEAAHNGGNIVALV